MTDKTGHGKNKTSEIDLKSIAPYSTPCKFALLEYRATDPLHDNKASLTFWIGKNLDDMDAKWEITFNQVRQKKFEVPGIAYKFMLINGEIYYRKNVEI